MSGEKQTLKLVFDNVRVEGIEKELAEVKKQMKELTFLLKNFNKFHNLPDWITKQQALEILHFSNHEFKKWVTAGLIRFKDATENGKIKVYSKADCLSFHENLEDYKIRMAISQGGSRKD